MRSAARARDDHLAPGGLRTLREGIEPLGRAVRGDDALIVADLECVERLGRMTHGRPVRLTPHDDGDGFGRHVRACPSAPAEKKAPYRGTRSAEASRYDSLTISGRSWGEFSRGQGP